jgi:hypothetical protein
MRSSQTTVRVAAEGEDAARVTLELRQKMRGLSRLAPFLVSRASRKVLDGALDGLVAQYE